MDKEDIIDELIEEIDTYYYRGYCIASNDEEDIIDELIEEIEYFEYLDYLDSCEDEDDWYEPGF